MGVDSFRRTDKTEAEEAFEVVHGLREILTVAVQAAMAHSNSPDAIVRAMERVLNENAQASREALELEHAEGDLESERTPGVTAVVTEGGRDLLVAAMPDIGAASEAFRVVDDGFEVKFPYGAYHVAPPSVGNRKVTIFRQASFGGGGQQKRDGLHLPVSEVVRVESQGGQRWRNLRSL